MSYQLSIKRQAKQKLQYDGDEYVPFDPADYIDNPVALARIRANLTQEELAKRMNVTQAYISKIEKQDKVTAKLMKKIKMAIEKK